LAFTGLGTVSERGNESLTVPEEVLSTSTVQQDTVNMEMTTEEPITTSKKSFWFWRPAGAPSAMPVVPTVSTDTTEATTAQVTTEATQTIADTTTEPSAELTTNPNMVVLTDSGHGHGTFNASVINPFSQEIKGNLYKYILGKILHGLNGKWKL
jgi:hypothetical protein